MIICSVIALGANLNQYKLVEEEGDWQPATATWYGSPNGDGSEGKGNVKFFI